jgi:hypothetical protein
VTAMRVCSALIFAALAACSSQPHSKDELSSLDLPLAPQEPGECNANGAQFGVGYDYSTALAEQVRQASGAAIVRSIGPGQAVTMDYRSNRLNLEFDAGGRVLRVRCG